MKTKGIFFFLIIFLITGLSSGKEFKGCYEGKYLFFKIVKNCVDFSYKNDEYYFFSDVRSIGIGKVFKDIHYYGFSLSNSDNPFYFEFIQNEKELISKQYLFFTPKNIIFQKLKPNVNIIKLYSNDNKYLDVFLASLKFYEKIPEQKKGKIKLFFNGKKYTVPYKYIKEEKIKTDAGKFKTYKVYVYPEIQGESLLKTKGKWIVWIDKKTKFPVKIYSSFIFGTIRLELINYSFND